MYHHRIPFRAILLWLAWNFGGHIMLRNSYDNELGTTCLVGKRFAALF